MSALLSIFALFLSLLCSAQFTVYTAELPSGKFAPTDTIWLSPSGSDAQPGTRQLPKKTFDAAVNALPFGTPGVQGGNAYGLIMLLPGHYPTGNGWQQSVNQFKQGNTYKNISLQGFGKVTLGGTPGDFAQHHVLQLRGSHIYIKNLKIQYSRGIGLLINTPDPVNERISNVYIENVEVDSVGSFSMLIQDVDTVTLRHVKSLYSARPGSDTMYSPCQWPSGIKFFGCTHATISGALIAYTRGEGLNFHNTRYGQAFDNHIHDNPTNIYLDNGSKVILRNNFIYAGADNPVYWRTCPGDHGPTPASRGILMANENACHGGGPVNNNCTTTCPLAGTTYAHVDSNFVYNNIFLNVSRALTLWEGTTQVLGGPNCIRNIFFTYNTIIGGTGDTTVKSIGLIDLFFPAPHNTITGWGWAKAENIQVKHNLFAFPFHKYPGIAPVRIVQDKLFPVPIDISIDSNRWNVRHAYIGPDGKVDTLMPVFYPENLQQLLDSLQPCDDLHPYFVQLQADADKAPAIDFQGRARNLGRAQVGALGYIPNCFVGGKINRTTPKVFLYPNPAHGQIQLRGAVPLQTQYTLVDAMGRQVSEGQWQGKPIEVAHLPNGWYVLLLHDAEYKTALTFLLQ